MPSVGRKFGPIRAARSSPAGEVLFPARCEQRGDGDLHAVAIVLSSARYYWTLQPNVTTMPSATPRACSILLLLGLLLPFGTACDTADTLLLNKAFVVGTWDLDSVRDDAGDRTPVVRTAVTELRITFFQDDTFDLRIRYTPIVDQEDEELSGTYTVSPSGQIFLTSAGISVPFNASIRGDNTLELSAPAALVAAVIAATNVDLGLVGTVVLTMERQAG